MKNVKAVVIFKNMDFPLVELINFTVNTMDANTITFPALYGPYSSFTDMYTDLLKALKTNNFYVKSYNDFNSHCYDIMFIDINNPGKTNHYYYAEE